MFRLNERDVKILMLLGKGYDTNEMAAMCEMHQPGIAKRVLEIEKELGRLVIRKGKKMTLNSKRTVLGSRVAVIAAEIDQLFAAMRQVDKYNPLTPESLAAELRGLANSIDISFSDKKDSNHS